MTELMAYADDLRIQGFADSTIYNYTRMLKLVEFELPGTRRDVKAWLSMRGRTVSIATLCLDLRALKSYSAWWAEESGQDDPLAAMPFPKQRTPPPGRIADEDDVHAVLRELRQWRSHPNNIRDYAIVATLRYTGMRRSELTRLNVDDIDFDAKRITIAAGKNGEGRIVPLHAEAGRAIRRYLTSVRDTHRHSDLAQLWLGRDGALRADSINKIFNRVSALAELDHPLTPHQFRRLLAKTWAVEGGSDDLLMLIAGWRSFTMVARYRAEAGVELANLQYDKIFEDKNPPRKYKLKRGRPSAA